MKFEFVGVNATQAVIAAAECAEKLVNEREIFVALFTKAIHGLVSAMREENKVINDRTCDPTSLEFIDTIFNHFHRDMTCIKVETGNCSSTAFMQMERATMTIFVNKDYTTCSNQLSRTCKTFLVIKFLHELFHFIVCIVNNALKIDIDEATPVKCGRSILLYEEEDDDQDNQDIKKKKRPTTSAKFIGDSGSFWEEQCFGYRILCSTTKKYSVPLKGIKVSQHNLTPTAKIDLNEDCITLLMDSLLTSCDANNLPGQLESLRKMLDSGKIKTITMC